MTPKTIAVLPGDGIGPEVVAAARTVLEAVAAAHGLQLELREGRIGGAAMDAEREPFPPTTRELCQAADAILLGAVGGPKWEDPKSTLRPEQGLLAVRREFGLFANLRPIRPLPELAEASPLRPEILAGIDILFVRELTGGIYFGAKTRNSERATDECAYTAAEIARVVRRAATIARGRRRRLTSVDMANTLATSRLWRGVADQVVRQEFPDVGLDHVLVDAMAMHLLVRPRDFDVVVTENLFGDVLTDEAAAIVGSLGMLPSASLGEGTFGLYEPVHGSAPELAGRGVANPFGAILSAALMLRHSLGLPEAAAQIESAVAGAVRAGAVTRDLTPDPRYAVDTQEATEAVLERLPRRAGSRS